MLKLSFMFNSFRGIPSRNMLEYFSTTTEVQNAIPTKLLPIFSKPKGLFMSEYNKQRNVDNNWFRYYYYNRLPLIFRHYTYGYRNWLLRDVLYPRWLKKATKGWRMNLFRRNRRLLRLKSLFLFLGPDLTRFKSIIVDLENKAPIKGVENKKNLTKLTSLQWQQLLQFKEDTNKAVYIKYTKYLNKFAQRYVSNKIKTDTTNSKIKISVSKKNTLRKLDKPYMLHIKFYKTQQLFYNFWLFKSNRRHFKKIKWIAKKRLQASLKKKIFRSYRTSLSVKKRKPYRLQKRTRAYTYKRFSYYWLRYFFKRFKQMYIDNNKSQTNYNDIKKYLLCWLWKVRTYKVFSLQRVNPARGFLLYKSNKLHNDLKAYGLFTGYEKLTFLDDRNELDEIFKSLVNKNRYLYRNFYWRFYKSALERRKVQILKRQYQFNWGLRPYIFVNKKQKVFYNWADRHIFKRFPLYRYKYTLSFKFPRFADYRRLFKNQLREQHVFRYLYRLKLSQLIKAFRKATYKTKRIFELMFLKYFELRLDTVVYRLNFAWSLKHARQLVLRGLFVVNNKVVDNHKYHVGLMDVIMPIKRLRMQPLSKKYLNYVDYGVSLSWTRLFYRPIQSDQYPDHFLLNERIPAGMVVNKFNPNTLRFNKPYSVQFLTLSLLKYN